MPNSHHKHLDTIHLKIESNSPTHDGQQPNAGNSSMASEIKSLEESFKSLFADKSKTQDFLAQKGRPAQQWLDRMQQLVDYPLLPPELRPVVLTAMLRLSKNSGLHPTCLSIHNVKKLGKHPVAAGGFGDVWKGTIGDSSKPVCLKVMKVNLNSDFKKLSIAYIREAILWRQLKHPNLVPFLGIYQLEDTQELWLISPWVENGNLVEFLRATEREDVDHYTLVYDVASRLAYLHSNKIVHGDLKGVNTLITDSLRACIADFGLSRIAVKHGLGLTTSGARPAGTMRWQAPELLWGERPSMESDMYSFACVCYECPTRPREALKLSDAMWALMTECWNTTPSSRPTAGQIVERVRDMAPRASDSLASDWSWSDSLLTQVRENVEYRSFSPEPSSGTQLG
ncbi:hypothetical protein PQX77_005141 [Marasmius sp. AFHP31]|nr:hypothetical protein PQX77_005141 [Marasmius sp. AFHP31]